MKEWYRKIEKERHVVKERYREVLEVERKRKEECVVKERYKKDDSNSRSGEKERGSVWYRETTKEKMKVERGKRDVWGRKGTDKEY